MEENKVHSVQKEGLSRIVEVGSGIKKHNKNNKISNYHLSVINFFFPQLVWGMTNEISDLHYQPIERYFTVCETWGI